MVEGGMTFTVFEAPDYFERPSRGDFDVARRVYLGAVPGGTDWIHDELTAEFTVPREIEVHRRSVEAGAGAEVVAIILVLLGVGAVEFARAFGKRAGEESADAVIDWMRARAQARREESGRRLDPPPDFERYDARELAAGMQGELADVTGRARESLQLVNAERTQTTALVAVYRDADEGDEWEVTVERDSATFKRR
jgi:hypothetical protein